MNREILFKAKRLDNGEWVDGFYCCIGPAGQEKHYIIPEYASAFYGVEVDPSTVCEYTGLNDKIGKKIFEGDVVIVSDESGEVYRFSVTFGQCGGIQNVDHDVGYMGFYFVANNEETKHCMKYGARNDMIYWLNAYKCEVIGNIHDGEDGQ